MPDIQVLQIDSATGLVSMGMGPAPKMLTGPALLAQMVALEYLKNPGRDVLDPNEGSGLRAAIGQYNLTGDDEIKLLVLRRTKDIERRIIARQTLVQDLTEKLTSLTVTDVAYDSSQGKVMIRVTAANEAGETKDILV